MNMEEEKDAFYVVRKGDIIGIYKNLSDCQAQVGSSVSDPAVSVFKGYGLTKEAEEQLVSHALRDAAYAVGAVHVNIDLFGKLTPCLFQQPTSSRGKSLEKDPPSLKRSRAATEAVDVGMGSTSTASNPHKHFKPDYSRETKTKVSSSSQVHIKSEDTETKASPPFPLFCILEFDGASRGNPGPAGAGAVLRAENGNLICRVRQGLGVATNSTAEYRGVILGLEYALRQGFKSIRVHGDSFYVCMQIPGLWKAKTQILADLCKEAQVLKNKFTSFEISHVPRESNSEADAQALLAVDLKAGEVEEDWI